MKDNSPKDYRLVYKCRMCNVKFEGDDHLSHDTAFVFMFSTGAAKTGHKHPNDATGLADVIGMRKILE